MKTPIYDFVRNYAEDNPLRLHMPGHKGINMLGCEAYDITEIEGADVLYSADSLIKESMDNTTELFGTGKTIYSTEGSSLSIKAMLFLALINSKGKKPIIAAGRNAHKTFLYGCGLLDIDVDWLYSAGDGLISCSLTPEKLEEYLEKNDPIAVYITSPDYLGNTVDIEGIAKVCKGHSTLLLVDNAHGAYLKFLSESRHPIDLGVDICCDSVHKTLPALTGAGYLHISKNVPKPVLDASMDAMSMFASTSPSYLILQSLDLVNGYLSEGYKEKLSILANRTEKLRIRLETFGYRLAGDEAIKLTIAPKSYGYTGYELSDYLLSKRIVSEFADPDYTVFMLTPEIDISALENALFSLEKRKAITDLPPLPTPGEKAMTPRQAMFSPSIQLPVKEALGRVLASPTVSCPPAIPIVASGEIISKSAIECFDYYGIKSCKVVANN